MKGDVLVHTDLYLFQQKLPNLISLCTLSKSIVGCCSEMAIKKSYPQLMGGINPCYSEIEYSNIYLSWLWLCLVLWSFYLFLGGWGVANEMPNLWTILDAMGWYNRNSNLSLSWPVIANYNWNSIIIKKNSDRDKIRKCCGPKLTRHAKFIISLNL